MFALAPGLNVLSLGAGAGALSSAAKPTVELEGQATQTRVVIVCHGGCGGVVTNEVSEGFGSANFFFTIFGKQCLIFWLFHPPLSPPFSLRNYVGLWLHRCGGVNSWVEPHLLPGRQFRDDGQYRRRNWWRHQPLQRVAARPRRAVRRGVFYL